MNVLDQSETCTSESECATSVDKSSSEDTERKNKDSKSSASSIKGVLAIPTTIIIPWTYSEHGAFLHGLYIYGKDWKQIAAHVHSRNTEEVQRHFHSFQKEEPFLFTLRRMLDDFALDHIIAWLPGGQSFRIYNELTCMRIAVLLYKGDSFNFDHFQKELCTHGFEQNAENGVWFHSDFCRNSSLELKQRDSKTNVCDYQFCKKTGNLMQCSGCRNVQYCCVACQQNDWSFHKWVCSKDMSGNDKPRRIDTSTSKQSHDKNVEVISKKSNQRKAKPITTSKSKIALKDDIKTNTGEWSVGEHCLFLEGLERYGRSWKNVASHVKTRTTVQVNNHARGHMKKIDCYWTTKEHLRFLEGLKRFGRGRWVVIATHVGTKNNKQVAFHAKEYFKEEKMNGMSQKMDSSLEDSVGIIKKSERDWYWSAEEHNRFLEGLEQHGRSWKHVASHVKTRSYAQVNGYGYRYLNKIDCYWTTKEHQLFLEGLKQYGRGHWVEIATHVGTKNNDQVAFHAKEYCKDEEINGKSQKTKNGSDEHSLVARKLVKKPNPNLINVSSTNVKRNIDQAGDSTSTSSSKRITRVSIKQKNDKQRIVTPEKNTGLEGDMQRMIDSTNSLKSVYQKKTDLQNGNEATCNNLVQESKKLYDKSLLLPFNAHQDVQGITEKEEVINDKKHSEPDDIDDTSCPICLEKFNDPHIVPECCHRFCKGCIEEALEYRRECPICRGRVTSRRALRRDEVFGKLMQLLEVERAKANANGASKLTITNTFAIDNHQAKTGEKNERIDVVKSIQEACMKKKEENQIQVKEEQNARNKNVEMKSQDKAIKIQFQHDGRAASDHTETQLEEKNTKIHTLENSVRTLSASVNDLKTQLRDKNDRIQFLESRQKIDEEHLQDDMKTSNLLLQTQLEEKNTKIKALEKLIRTLSDQTRIREMAAAVNDLQSQSQHKDDRIQFLESRHKADEEKLQQHCKKSEEKNLKIKTLEKQIRTLSEHTLLQKNERLVTKLQQQNDVIKNLKSRQKDDEKHHQNMAALLKELLKEKKLSIKTLEKKIEQNDVTLKNQLQEKNDRIQFLESKQKAEEEKVQNMAKQALVSKDLENQLKEKKARIQTLEKMVRTLSHDSKLQKIAAKFQEKNDRIKDFEEKLQQMTKKLEEGETKLQPINDRIQYLESKEKADKEKLQCLSQAS